MKRFLLLLPLIPFLWQSRTPFALDALLLVNAGLCIAALLTRLGKLSLFVLWLTYIYAVLFHYGTLRNPESEATWPIAFGIVAAVIVVLYVMLEMDLNEVFRERRSVVAAFLLTLVVIVIVGLLVDRYTQGPLSRFSLSVLINISALILAISVWSLIRRQGSAEYGVVLLAVAAVSLFGFGRGAVQGVLLNSRVQQADALLENGQFEQALETYDTALAVAQQKELRPVLFHLHVQRLRTLAGLDRHVAALDEAQRAMQLQPENRHEVVAYLDVDFLSALSGEPLDSQPWTLAVDLEVTPDGRGLFVLDRFGRVFERRDDAWESVFDAGLTTDEEIREAVDLELSDNGAGFLILDNEGGLHLGGTPSDELSRMDLNKADFEPHAVDAELSADETSLYILDRYGRVTAFGRQDFSVQDLTQHFWRAGLARDLEIVSNGSLLLLDAQGATHWIGERTAITELTPVPYWPDKEAARDVTIWPNGRSWAVLDLNGAVHVVGPPQFDTEKARPFYRYPYDHAVDMEIVQQSGELVLLSTTFNLVRVGP